MPVEDWEKNKPLHMTIGENDAYKAGVKAERDEILELVKKEYPLITSSPLWKNIMRQLEG